MEYTKGEWMAKDYEVWAGDLIVAECPYQTPLHFIMRGANARLISAAPNQHEALLEIDRWLLDNPDVSDDPQLHSIHIHIQDALSKAK